MYATAIRMKPGRIESNSPEEIDTIYLEQVSVPGWYKKADVHDYVVQNPGVAKVNIPPYPALLPATSSKGEKYVRSTPNPWDHDNLLSLPRE